MKNMVMVPTAATARNANMVLGLTRSCSNKLLLTAATYAAMASSINRTAGTDSSWFT
jgi:hypothetical protein